MTRRAAAAARPGVSDSLAGRPQAGPAADSEAISSYYLKFKLIPSHMVQTATTCSYPWHTVRGGSPAESGPRRRGRDESVHPAAWAAARFRFESPAQPGGGFKCRAPARHGRPGRGGGAASHGV